MLFNPTQTAATDSEGNKVLLTDHPPPYTPGPYSYQSDIACTQVPSLVSLCIRALVPYPDQVYQLPVKLNLRPSLHVLHDLIPDPAAVDPRLWAVLVQVYDALPASFASYVTPLADTYLPLLQAIPNTPMFSMVTVLDLPACRHLTDDTIVQLKFLHTLTAFDASQTRLSVYGVRSLAATLQIDDETNNRGPWPLRLLSLRNCRKVTKDVYEYLEKFPLLSVVGEYPLRHSIIKSHLTRRRPSRDALYPTRILLRIRRMYRRRPLLARHDQRRTVNPPIRPTPALLILHQHIHTAH